MSINNIENIAFNYLTNLTTINADEVNTDILTKIDPDISDLQFDMLEGIHTDETIQQQIDNIETQIGNIGASYWLSAWDTTTQTNPVANTPRAMTWNSSDPSGNGIVAGPISGSMKVLNTDAYNIQFSVEIKSSTSSTSEITIWLRKNGSDVADTASEYNIKGNDFYTIGWNFVVPLVANDYVQLMWASSDTTMTLYYQAPQTSPYTHPAIPSVIITVTNVTGEGPAGAQGPPGPEGPQGDRGPRGYKGEKGDPGSGTVDDVARALAGSALALATAAEATAISAQATASAAAAANTIQDIEIASLQSDVSDLNTKTTDMSYGSLSGTTFDRTVHINNTGGSVGSDAIELSSSGPASFLYGIDNLSVTNSLTIDDVLYIGRADRSSKKVVLYDNNTGDNYDFTGIFNSYSTSSNFFNFEIDGNAGSAFRYYYGNGLGSSRTLAKELNSANELTYTAASSFLKQNGYSQQIRMYRDIPNNKVVMELLGDSAGANAYDGEIIQDKGNSYDNNSGTITIQSGTLALNSLMGDTIITSSDKVNINSNDEINIAAASVLGSINLSTTTTDININSAAAFKTTSAGTTQINSVAFDVNATGAITMDTTSTITTTSTGKTQINCNEFNATSTGGGTIQTAGSLNLTSTGVGATNSFNITSSTVSGFDLTLNNTTAAAFKIRHLDNLQMVSGPTKGTEINAGTVGILLTTTGGIDLNASTGGIDLTTTGPINQTCTDNFFLTSTSGNIIQEALGNITLTSTSSDVILTGTDLTMNSSVGSVNITAASGYSMTATTNDLAITSVAGGVLIDAYGQCSLDGGSIIATSASTSQLTSTSNISITSTSGEIDLLATNGEVSLTSGTQVRLTTTGSGDININSADTMTMAATNGITANNKITLNGDFHIQQTTLSGMATTQLGYTNVVSGASKAMTSGTWIDMYGTYIPAGAWIVSFTITTSTTGGAGTVNDLRFLLSTTNVAGGNTPYRTFKWLRASDDSVAANGDRDWISLTGVVNNTASTQYFVQGLATVSGISMTAIVNSFTYTRIG